MDYFNKTWQKHGDNSRYTTEIDKRLFASEALDVKMLPDGGVVYFLNRCRCSALLISLQVSVCAIGFAQKGSIDAATQAQIAASVAVERIQVGEPGSGANLVPVTFQLKNTSAQAIYAFSYAVTARYADGSSQSQSGSVDLLALYAQRMRISAADEHFLPPLLRPGEVFSCPPQSVPVSRRNEPPVGAEVEIRMLVFEDRTAIGDERQIASEFRRRQADAVLIAGVLDDLRSAQKAGDPVGVLERRSKDISAGIAKEPNGRTVGSVTVIGPDGIESRVEQRSARATHLQWAMSDRGDRTKMAARLLDYEQYLQALKLHSVRAGAKQ